jgi:hypothetical protein
MGITHLARNIFCVLALTHKGTVNLAPTHYSHVAGRFQLA